MNPAAELRFMAEWPPHAIDEDERAAVLAGAEALEQAGRLRDLLHRIEWAAGDDFGAACPECQGYRDSADGHLPDCELAALIGGGERAAAVD